MKSTNMQASGCLSGIPTGFKSLDEVITGLKEKGDFRKDQAKEICEYFNCKLGGSKIPAQKRLDIERSLRVKDAVDVLDTLENAFIEIGKALKTYAHFTKNN
ncbi:MAG: DnaB-like helicase C-terminal domain-containing protein [Bacteroidaceae bacterium]|nr:DnaB-like helicase C-terminal domain-containing protein [Bacteroidaceae bacterium]